MYSATHGGSGWLNAGKEINVWRKEKHILNVTLNLKNILNKKIDEKINISKETFQVF